MAQMMNEILWSDPILPVVSDPAWEAEVKRRGGAISDVHRRVAPSPWLRETCLRLDGYRVAHLPVRYVHLGGMVTAQENSCRYCYGATRGYLRIMGYSDRLIGRIERETQLAELDPRERSFLEFARNLARSKPRPARAQQEALVAMGFPALAVTEMAVMIAFNCMYNRIATLVASPPEAGFEKFANGPLGRLLGLAGPLLRYLDARKHKRGSGGQAAPAAQDGPFQEIIAALALLPAAASLLSDAIGSALASPVLPRRIKTLMFAVVAKTLDCPLCQGKARELVREAGFPEAEIDACLASLNSPRLEPHESAILSWTRDTVHYQTGPIQEQTRALGDLIGPAALLEAIGVAALANATVRLAMLAE